MKLTRFEHLEALVLQWADNKGILENGTKEGQAAKTLEEAAEILVGIARGNKEDIIDGIGDTLVTLIIQAEMNNVDILDCLETAYTEIAYRQGKMINGQFVKDE